MVVIILHRVATGFVWLAFYLLRFGERLLPQTLLSFFLWPLAVIWGLSDFRKLGRVLSTRDRFPEPWRPGLVALFFRQGVLSNHSRFVYLWPDRLKKPDWRRRCRLSGAGYLGQSMNGRRTILASLHFGPFETLPYWLRAHGLPSTVLVGRPAPRRRLKQRQYALSAPADVPVVMPVGETARMRQVLREVRHLIVMMDVDRGKQISVLFEQYIFRLATGAIRLAAVTGAELIPCLIFETDTWEFTIHFGNPVPRQHLLAAAPNLEAAARHLLTEFLPIISRDPAQCGPRLLSCITPAKRSAGSY